MDRSPTPTVPFPQASSTPVQHYEQQNLFLSCTPLPIISVAEENVVNSSSVVRHFAPCDLLPIPKEVQQSGPRMSKSNKRLGSARNLTSDLKLQKIKEAYDEKLREETKKQEAALKKASNQAKTKDHTVRVCLYFKVHFSCFFNN